MGTILVTDDDENCRNSIQSILQREGHTVVGVPDVNRALEALDGHDFELIVCDYRMPGRNGLDFLAELRKRNCVIPVLMISAFADSDTEAAARFLGARGVLRKPFRRRELVESAEILMQKAVSYSR